MLFKINLSSFFRFYSLVRLVILILAINVILIGCKQSPIEQFQKEAISFAENDKKIDEKEFNQLLELIKSFSENDKNKFIDEKNGQIDQSRVAEYLKKYFLAKKLPPIEIWQSTNENTKSKFSIDVYIENSASMDGYVKGVTEFETAIYNLLGDIKISDLCSSLNLNYINKDITFTKKNALPSDIQDFIEKLEPSSFKQKGGDRSTSDLSQILKTVVKKVDVNNAAILVSDFVFSPGNKNNAQDYLNNQSVGIKIDFAEKLKSYDLSVIIIQLESNFDGNYYDKTNQVIPFTGKRPYYIWFFGNESQIKSILDNKMLDNIKGGFKNRIVFTSIKEKNPLKYKILLRPRIGEFKLPNGANGEITEAAVSRENQTKGQFSFSVAVNFSNSLQNSNFFLDTTNYRLSNNKYTLSVKPVDSNDQALADFTHILTLQTNEPIKENLKIDIVGKLPDWVNKSTSIDDSKIATDDEEKQKTFGLKYLIEGVNDAFYPQSSENIINTLTISINK